MATALVLLLQGCTEGAGAGRPDKRVFDLVNRQRAAAGLPRLAWDEDAARAARAHSARMKERGFFAHEDPERGGVARRATAAGIGWTAVAENIYSSKGYPRPADAAVAAWMKSPAHRRNALNPRYTRTGVGVVTAPDGTYRFTQIYFRP